MASAKGAATKSGQCTDCAARESKPASGKGQAPPPPPIELKPAPDGKLAGDCWDFVLNDPEQSDLRSGVATHSAIREHLSPYFRRIYGPHIPIRLPDASFDHFRSKNGLDIGSKGHGHGDVDLAFRSISNKVMLLAEIKPANKNYVDGEEQLKNYIDKANANDKIKQKYDVKVFSPMLPVRFVLPQFVFVRSARYEIRWCSTGMMLYKKVRKKKGEDEEEKEKAKGKSKKLQKGAQPAKAYNEEVIEQRKEATRDRATNQPQTARVLPAKSRPLEAWTPEQLRRDIESGSLQNGLYRERYSATWPSGHRTNVVVWVRSGEVQYYQEYPEAPDFYEWFAQRRGLSQRQADLIRRTLIDYNRDMWSLIAPDPVTGAPSSRSPYYAREVLRALYEAILKGVVEGSAAIAGAGAGITSVSSAMRQRATAREPIASKPRQLSTEEPMPTWFDRVVDIDDATRSILEVFERAMRGVPVP